MRILFLSVFLGTVFSVSALAQAMPASTAADTPALQVTRPIYAWKTESDTNKKTGQFNHCLVKNMYDNGTVLMVAENHEGVKRLALNFPQDKMTAGEHYDLTLQVDKRDVFPVEAVAISPQILTIGIPDALPDQMRKGQAIYLRGPNDEVVYTLDGADGAITALQDCMLTQKGHATTLQTADATEATQKAALPTLTDSENDPKAPVEPLKIPEAKAELAPVTTPVPVAVPATVPAPASAPVTTPVKTEKIAEKPVVPAPVAKAAVVAAAPVATAKPQPQAPQKNALEKLADKLPNLKQEKKIEVVAEAPAPTAPASAGSRLPDDLHALFTKAEMLPTAFISTPDKNQDKNKESKRPLDFAWMNGELFIGTKQQPPVPDVGLTKASVYYLRMLKDQCTGPFIAEAGTIVKTPSLSWLVVEAACSPGKKDDTIAALLFANNSKNLSVYFFEAPAKNGAQAIKARDAFLKTLQATLQP